MPQESLFSAPVLISVLGSAIIQFVFQIYVFVTVESHLGPELFVKCEHAADVEDDDPPCSKNTALYLLTTMQYVICCLCFSISKPFRKAIWTNPLYFVSVILMTAYQLYLVCF